MRSFAILFISSQALIGCRSQESVDETEPSFGSSNSVSDESGITTVSVPSQNGQFGHAIMNAFAGYIEVILKHFHVLLVSHR